MKQKKIIGLHNILKKTKQKTLAELNGFQNFYNGGMSNST